MTYYSSTTDASDEYRPNASAALADTHGTPVDGNLGALMKNNVVVLRTWASVNVSEASPEPSPAAPSSGSR